MCDDISNSSGGWPRTPDELMKAVLLAWDNASVNDFRELIRSHKQRLISIVSVNGDRHPEYA